MRPVSGFVLGVLAALPPAAAAPEKPNADLRPPSPPVTFALGGQEVHVSLHPFGWPALAKWEVVLTAFGRTWSGPAPVAVRTAAATATMQVPGVRVPTVFSVVDQNQRLVGEVVAYPAGKPLWDPKKAEVYAIGAPTWFGQWAMATGLPTKAIKPEELSAAALRRAGGDAEMLLVLGRGACGPSLGHVAKLAKEARAGALVLDADWFGGSADAAEVAPPQMRGGLGEVAGQRWPRPLAFASCRGPWPGIANRWVWIAGEHGLPLVEAVAAAGSCPAPARPVVLSYLPWQEQLGRSESADAALLALLTATASAPAAGIAGHPVEFIHPLAAELSAKDRPVLAAVRSVEPVLHEDRKPDYNPPIYYVVDFRGQGDARRPGGDLSQTCRRAIEDRQPDCRLLVLGDDPVLDTWKWLKLDRAKKAIRHPGVVWLPDDRLPPSTEEQVRLMLRLTEFGVVLAPPEQEEEQK